MDFFFVLHYFSRVGRCSQGWIAVKMNTQKMEATAIVGIATTISLDAKVWFLFRTSQQLNKNNNEDQRIEFGYVDVTLSENWRKSILFLSSLPSFSTGACWKQSVLSTLSYYVQRQHYYDFPLMCFLVKCLTSSSLCSCPWPCPELSLSRNKKHICKWVILGEK